LTFQRDTAFQLALRLNMRCILATLAVVALLFSAGAAWADWDDIREAFNQGEYAIVMEELHELAEEGDGEAQTALGEQYSRDSAGIGTPQNYTEAVKWYRKAAEQGEANAQSDLGIMYHHGNGVPQNYAEALKWVRKAAEQGDAEASFELGWKYQYGYRGIPQDLTEATKWYLKAGRAGSYSVAGHCRHHVRDGLGCSPKPRRGKKVDS